VVNIMPHHIESGAGTFFKQKKNYRDVFQFFFFARTKIKTDPNYSDENYI